MDQNVDIKKLIHGMHHQFILCINFQKMSNLSAYKEAAAWSPPVLSSSPVTARYVKGAKSNEDSIRIFFLNENLQFNLRNECFPLQGR